MRLVMPREEFLEAVGWTARIVPARPYTPVLGGIRIRVKDGSVDFAAFDTELSSEMSVALADNDWVNGEVLVSGRLLAAISKVLPKQPVRLYTEGSQGTAAFLQCGKAEFSLPTMPIGEYPTLPLLPDDAASIDGAELSTAVAQLLPAVSSDQAQPQLCAIAMEFTSATMLTLFATDKHRVAIREIGWSPKDPDPAMWKGQKLLVPSRAVSELGRLGAEEFVYLGAEKDAAGILGIRAGRHRTTTRLIDSPYPNCRSIMAKHHDGLAVVNTPDLLEALQRAILLDEDEFPRVFLKFSPGLIELTGGREGVGGVTDELDADFNGMAQQLHVNPRYLLDALLAVRSDKAVIALQGHQKPLTVAALGEGTAIPGGDGTSFPPLQADYLHLVMPTAGPHD